MRCNEKSSVIMRRLVQVIPCALIICLLIYPIRGAGQDWAALATGVREQPLQEQIVNTMAEISHG